MVKRFHTDKNANNPKTDEICKAITKAYRVLGDPVERKKYDITLNSPKFKQKENPYKRKQPNYSPKFKQKENPFKRKPKYSPKFKQKENPYTYWVKIIIGLEVISIISLLWLKKL